LGNNKEGERGEKGRIANGEKEPAPVGWWGHKPQGGVLFRPTNKGEKVHPLTGKKVAYCGQYDGKGGKGGVGKLSGTNDAKGGNTWASGELYLQGKWKGFAPGGAARTSRGSPWVGWQGAGGIQRRAGEPTFFPKKGVT